MTAYRLHTAIAALLVVGVYGCGDPLVEGDYRGQPLMTVEGTIDVEDGVTSSDAAKVRVAILWVGAGQDLATHGQSESAFPARYSLEIFSTPPAGAMSDLADQSGRHATGRIVVYLDDDGDERLDLDEEIVGASPDQILAYFTSADATSLVTGSLQTGYQVMHIIECTERVEDKAMFASVEPGQINQADLILQEGVAQGLTDLDCDNLSDDFCFDLRLRIQGQPDNQELAALYRSQCEAPETTSPKDETGDGSDAPDDGKGSDDRPAVCEDEPDLPECTDEPTPVQPDDEQSAAEVVRECSALLGQVGYDDALESDAVRDLYWQFSQCTKEHDPCGSLGWSGRTDGWREYQTCLFAEFPAHKEDYCSNLEELMTDTTDTDRARAAEQEHRTAGCPSDSDTM